MVLDGGYNFKLFFKTNNKLRISNACSDDLIRLLDAFEIKHNVYQESLVHTLLRRFQNKVL